MRYGVVTDGEPFEIRLAEPLILQCCECGLVHRIKFKVKGTKLEINIRGHVAETKKVRGQQRVRRSIRELKG